MVMIVVYRREVRVRQELCMMQPHKERNAAAREREPCEVSRIVRDHDSGGVGLQREP